TESILNQTDTNLFMCHVNKPLIADKRMVVFCPPLAESELGFSYWMEKIFRLSKELTIQTVFICNPRTRQAITEYHKTNKHTVRLQFSQLDDWDDLTVLSTLIKEGDLIVFVSTRSGEVSYRHAFDVLPVKL